MPFKDIFHHKKDRGSASPEKDNDSGRHHLFRRSSSSKSEKNTRDNLHQSRSTASMSYLQHTKIGDSDSSSTSSSPKEQHQKHRKHSESVSLGNLKPLSNSDRRLHSTFDIPLSSRNNNQGSGPITHAPGKINQMTRRVTHDGSPQTHSTQPPAAPAAPQSAPKPLPSIDAAPIRKKPSIVYNPYGVSSITNYSSGSHYGYSHYGTTNHTTMNTSSSQYSEEKQGLLPLPIEIPNDYLPEKLQQENIDLYAEYILPDADSSKNKKLGDGASSSVRTIIRRSDKKVFALKKFTLFKNETPQDFYTRCVKEYIIAKSLSSYPHIVSTFALVRVPSISNLQRGWGFVLEYCKGGDLFSLIQRSGWKSTKSEEKFCIFKQIALGVKFIHDNDIVHRDLKPENVLITENGMVKLTDFGVSTDGHVVPGDFESDVKLSTSFVGSPPYAPPEVMYFKSWNRKLKDDPNLPRYDPFKMDCWGLGMLLFCMTYQATPFMEALGSDSLYREYTTAYSQFVSKNPTFRRERIKGPGVEYKFGQGFHDSGASRVAWRLCDPDPKTRYTLRDLFEDKWFLNLEMCHSELDEECLLDRMMSQHCTTSELFHDKTSPSELANIELKGSKTSLNSNSQNSQTSQAQEQASPQPPKKSMLEIAAAAANGAIDNATGNNSGSNNSSNGNSASSSEDGSPVNADTNSNGYLNEYGVENGIGAANVTGKKSMIDSGLEAKDGTPPPVNSSSIAAQVPHSLSSSLKSSAVKLNGGAELFPLAEECSVDSCHSSDKLHKVKTNQLVEQDVRPQLQQQLQQQQQQQHKIQGDGRAKEIEETNADDTYYDAATEDESGAGTVQGTPSPIPSASTSSTALKNNEAAASNGGSNQTAQQQQQQPSKPKIRMQAPQVDPALPRSERIAGTDVSLRDLPENKYCKGAIRRHHHNEVLDITLNALGGVGGALGGANRLYSRVL